ncbi:hypothetical protein BGX27_005212, partial [Mortierella sp. AM989]
MTLKVVRPLDLMGRYLVANSNIKYYNNFLVGNKIQLRKENNPSFSSWKTPQKWAQLLLNPVAHLASQFPTLALSVGDHHGDNPVYLRLESIDLEQLIRVVPIDTATDIERLIEEEHNIPFYLSDTSLPFWRLAIAPIEDDDTSFYLLFVSQHAGIDGRSVMVLLEQLVEQLNLSPNIIDDNPDSTIGASTKILFTSDITFPSPLEERIDCSISYLTLATTIVKLVLLPTFLKKALEYKYWAGEFDNTLETPYDVQTSLLQLMPEETSRIIQAAKRRSTTVQAVIYSASVFAIRSVFMPKSEQDEAITYDTVVDIRKRILNPIPRTDFGIYTTAAPRRGIYVKDESSFWNMAQEYKEDLTEKTSSEEKIRALVDHLGSFRLLPNKASAWEQITTSQTSQYQHGRSGSISMSNIGVGWNQDASTTANSSSSENKEALRYLVKDAILSKSPILNNVALAMTAATANGTMSIITTWNKAAFGGRHRVQLYMSELKRIILEAADDGRETYLFKDAKRTCDHEVAEA